MYKLVYAFSIYNNYYREDNDKHVLRKQERKEEKERREQERLQRKQETQRMLDEETSHLKSAKPVKPEKVTQFQIQINKEKEEAEKRKYLLMNEFIFYK